MKVPGWGLFAVFLFGVFMGWLTNGWRLEAEIAGMQRDGATATATQTTNTLNQERQANHDAHAADAAPAAAQQAQQVQARVIVNEVIRYVQTPAAALPLPAEWVQNHDAAASGLPADSSAAGGPAAAAGNTANPVSNGEALGIVTSNYDTCRQELIRISRWQAWWNSVKPAQ